MKKNISINKNKLEQEFLEEIDELTLEIEKQNSPARVFWLAIIRGLGTAIGATLVFGIFVALLGVFVKTGQHTWLERVLELIRLGAHSS